jgi:hypothetical protein
MGHHILMIKFLTIITNRWNWIITIISDDEDYEPPTAAVPAVATDKWDGEDSDDDNIKDAWDAVSVLVNSVDILFRYIMFHLTTQ